MEANEIIVALLAAGMLVAAFVYASVGHGGASAYLAAWRSPASRRRRCGRSRCVLNVVVSAVATFKFYRAGYFRWRLFWPFAASLDSRRLSRRAITLPGHAYKTIVGVVLVYAAWQLWRSARAVTEMREVREPPLGWQW